MLRTQRTVKGRDLGAQVAERLARELFSGRYPPGCRFHPRCPLAEARCREERPLLRAMAPEGAVAYLIRTSAISDTPFDLDYLAATRLAEGPFPQARVALTKAHEAWLAATVEAVGDPVLARAIVLVSDGLYLEAATRRGPRTPAPTPDGPQGRPTSPAGAADLVALLESVIASRRA